VAVACTDEDPFLLWVPVQKGPVVFLMPGDPDWLPLILEWLADGKASVECA